MLIVRFVSAFKIARHTNGIHKDPNMWLSSLPHKEARSCRFEFPHIILAKVECIQEEGNTHQSVWIGVVSPWNVLHRGCYRLNRWRYHLFYVLVGYDDNIVRRSALEYLASLVFMMYTPLRKYSLRGYMDRCDKLDVILEPEKNATVLRTAHHETLMTNLHYWSRASNMWQTCWSSRTTVVNTEMMAEIPKVDNRKQRQQKCNKKSRTK